MLSSMAASDNAPATAVQIRMSSDVKAFGFIDVGITGMFVLCTLHHTGGGEVGTISKGNAAETLATSSVQLV